MILYFFTYYFFYAYIVLPKKVCLGVKDYLSHHASGHVSYADQSERSGLAFVDIKPRETIFLSLSVVPSMCSRELENELQTI